MTVEQHQFQAEVSKLLHIVANSLYSDKEIFLRELIANASDACDKLRYDAITNKDLLGSDSEFKVSIAIDKENKTITICDNGIGMDKNDLIKNLGTIAHSGTASFIEKASADKDNSMSLVGQFGVGFYSAFIVSDQITVKSLKAGDSQGWSWISDGTGSFSLEENNKKNRGTEITLHLKEGEEEFLEEIRLQTIVKKYSDHIAIPLMMVKEDKEEQINNASALWTRPKSDITEEQYKEFYHHTAHMPDDPELTLHYRAEGIISYTSLLFIPSSRPFDLFHPDRQNHLKLYVKRVFITDNCSELLPSYLRFVRGIVDSEDLQLNISREMLQKNPVLSKIRQGITKKILGELEKLQDKNPESYKKLWENFGAVIKEGLYEDPSLKETLFNLCRFHSLNSDEMISLDQYVDAMPENQKEIFYIIGESKEALKRSPQLEGFKAKNIDVLLLTDAIDDFWVPMITDYKETNFTSITRGKVDLDKIAESSDAKKTELDKETKQTLDSLIGKLKTELQDEVSDVRISERLTDSAVCLVADEGQMDIRLERLLKQQGKDMGPSPTKKIMEINSDHPLIKRLADLPKGQELLLKDAAHLLFEQAMLLEGEKLMNPKDFVSRINHFMEKAMDV
jgi:molecular chaperone HtpG